MADWLEDLADFPAMYVAEACKEWRQTQTKRPLPADIRRLAIEAKRYADEARAPRQLPPPRRDRPPSHVVRENWRDLAVRDRTSAEIELGRREMETKAAELGMTYDEFKIVCLRDKRPPKAKMPMNPGAEGYLKAKMTPDRLDYLTSLLPGQSDPP